MKIILKISSIPFPLAIQRIHHLIDQGQLKTRSLSVPERFSLRHPA